MFHSFEEEAARELNKLNAERYKKLKILMGMNRIDTWAKVENLGAISCYVNEEMAFDGYLDDINIENLSRCVEV